MIKNFDEVKQQLRELSEIVNAYNSEAVQLKVVDLVLGPYLTKTGGNEPHHVDDANVSTKSVRTPSRPASGREAKTSPNSNRAGRKLGGKALLARLYDEGFFKGTQQTIGAIVVHADRNLATKVKQSDLSGPLARYVRDGKLRRSKNAENQYEYVQE